MIMFVLNYMIGKLEEKQIALRNEGNFIKEGKIKDIILELKDISKRLEDE